MDRFSTLVSYARFTYDRNEPADLTKELKVMPFYNKKSAQVITIEEYLNRLIRYSDISPEIMLTSLLFLRRFNERYNINSRNFYRLILISLFISMKLNDDFHHSAKYMAILGGLQSNIKEFLKLEKLFLKSIDWEIIIDKNNLELMALSVGF